MKKQPKKLLLKTETLSGLELASERLEAVRGGEELSDSPERKTKIQSYSCY